LTENDYSPGLDEITHQIQSQNAGHSDGYLKD